MLTLFNFFVDICLLRRKPQDLPASTTLFVALVLVNLLIAIIGISGLIPPASAVAAAMLDAVLLMTMLRLVLSIQNRTARFLQSATAIFGSGIVLGLIALPLQLALDQSAEASAITQLASIAYLILLIWSQLVVAHVLRHALDISLVLGVGLALTYAIVSGVLIQTLFMGQLPATG